MWPSTTENSTRSWCLTPRSDCWLGTIPGVNASSDHEFEGDHASEIDQPRIEAAVREILAAIGEDVHRNGLVETPARVARMYAEICAGLHEEPAEHLTKVFEAGHDEMVMVRDIPLYSL